MAKYITKYYTVTTIPDEDNNKITASGNFRIFTVDEPLTNVVKITAFSDDVVILESQEPNLKKYIRYSKDGSTWSMWYEIESSFTKDDINKFTTLEFDPDDEIYFSFKYEYDDGTHDELEDIISVDKFVFQLQLRVIKVPLALNKEVAAKCTPEQCADLMFDRNIKLDLYDIGNLGEVYLSMSMSMNLFAGLPALYFQTSPDSSGTDFVFREYSLYNVIQRKCIKVVVKGNEFPDAAFQFQGVGMEYAGPLEINIDKRYYESMFGTGKEPRKKDFLYFPIMNRMYEIQDVTMYRGLMMMPVYWIIQLVKFRPNINLLTDNEQTEFLDNMILDSEEQFGKEAKEQILDATMPSQLDTVSRKTDEVRSYLDRAIHVQEAELNFNYTRMINYYYQLKCTGFERKRVVVYKEDAKLAKGNDSTFVFSFKLNNGELNGQNVTKFITTTNDENICIYGTGSYRSGRYSKYNIILSINKKLFKLDLGEKVLPNVWYSAVIGVSPTYKQVEMYAYSYEHDDIDNNITGFKRMNSMLMPVTEEDITVESDGTYCLEYGNTCMANIRIFNRCIEFEKHEYVISQLFIKDESMLRVIDNCRPKLDMPYIMKKY